MKLWLFYALISALCAVIMAMFLIIIVLFQGNIANISEIFSDKKALFFIACSGIAGASSWLFYFLALKHGQVSQVAPIDKLSVVFAVLLAIIFFGERVSFVHGIGIALIAIGSLILAIF